MQKKLILRHTGQRFRWQRPPVRGSRVSRAHWEASVLTPDNVDLPVLIPASAVANMQRTQTVVPATHAGRVQHKGNLKSKAHALAPAGSRS